MGPYGSVGAHIKTGKRYMAQDHFKNPPDPKKDNGMNKNHQTSKKYSSQEMLPVNLVVATAAWGIG